ncbi:hypothetical protein APW50_05850 [Staphylococcus aureus]|nr:hypothetical protein APW50_05850 [Staphylococcus aureus]
MGMATYAVVDLETTGNQLDFDDIIQIGITFVRNNQIIDTYHSMIRTNLEIPQCFVQLYNSVYFYRVIEVHLDYILT